MTVEFPDPKRQRGYTPAPKPLVDERVLTTAMVRKLLQVLHPDAYGRKPEMARELFEFFKVYKGRE